MISLAFALLSSVSFAQAPSPFPACSAQIKNVCGGAADPRATVQCLRKNADQLSTDCKLDLERYAQASRQAAARAGGALGGFGGLTGLTPPLPLFTYEGRLSKDLYENRANLSSPVSAGETSLTSASLAGGQLHFKDPVTLTNGRVLPSDLYRAELGTQTSWRLEGRRNVGVRLSVGSTGDQVFQALRDANFSLALTYGFPGSAPGDYWVALVYFANNSTLGDYVPLPGAIYIHKTEHFTGLFGFPVLSLQWTPNSTWAYSFSILGTTLITEAAYGSVTASQVYLQGSFNQQRFILHDRVEDRDRLNFEEKKIGFGYRTPLLQAAFGEIQIGRAFGRQFYIGQKIFKTDGGLAVLDDSAYVNASFKYVF